MNRGFCSGEETLYIDMRAYVNDVVDPIVQIYLNASNLNVH